ncbi:MAG: hypothetical protein KHX02_00300 [Collinsella stercoris]|nr:hypothetical protein [Collinsella stercoris]
MDCISNPAILPNHPKPIAAQSGYFDHNGETEWERNQNTHLFIQAQLKIARFYAMTQNPGIEHLLGDLSERRSKPYFEKQRVSEISSGQLAANRQFTAAV